MQRHYVKLLLRTAKTNKLQQHPIYLRLTIERNVSYSATGHWVHKSLWDQKGERVKDEHPMAQEINTDITNKKRQVLQELVQAGVQGKRVTVQQVKARTALSASDIFAFSETYIEELRTNKKREESTLGNYEKHLRKLEEYRGSRCLSFEEITLDYLNSFETWLRTVGVERQARKGRDGSNG